MNEEPGLSDAMTFPAETRHQMRARPHGCRIERTEHSKKALALAKWTCLCRVPKWFEGVLLINEMPKWTAHVVQTNASLLNAMQKWIALMLRTNDYSLNTMQAAMCMLAGAGSSPLTPKRPVQSKRVGDNTEKE